MHSYPELAWQQLAVDVHFSYSLEQRHPRLVPDDVLAVAGRVVLLSERVEHRLAIGA
jgi:hypothetical protein